VLNSLDMRLDTDPSAFFNEFHPRVFRYIAGSTGAPAADVDDLVQETLLEAWKNRAQYNGDSSLGTWVLAIARNRVKMRLRSLGRRGEIDRALRAMDREEISDAVLRDEETVAAVRRALEALPADQADALILRYYEGRSVRDIAASLGDSEKAVESRLHRAREALRELLILGGTDEF
jgi:RNA polymerase sigma-70 factor (ECF subfamily)